MLKDFELFSLFKFKVDMDTVAQKLVEYSNEYNEILSKIRDNGIDEISWEEREMVVKFYQKLINDERFINYLEITYNIINKLKRSYKKCWDLDDLAKNMKK